MEEDSTNKKENISTFQRFLTDFYICDYDLYYFVFSYKSCIKLSGNIKGFVSFVVQEELQWDKSKSCYYRQTG